MKSYSDKDIENARRLRKKKHYSFAQLQKITGIPANTIRNWCDDLQIGTKWDTMLLTLERRRKELKKSEISILNTIKRSIDRNTAKLYAALLYWCEGSKYPSSNALTFVNSDPLLVKSFIFYLEKDLYWMKPDLEFIFRSMITKAMIN